jgi:glycerol-3-phosphate dehydrogenase (NAD+)
MQGRPTGVVAACKDIDLGREIQELFASPNMRVNTTTDVTGAAGGQRNGPIGAPRW